MSDTADQLPADSRDAQPVPAPIRMIANWQPLTPADAARADDICRRLLSEAASKPDSKP